MIWLLTATGFLLGLLTGEGSVVALYTAVGYLLGKVSEQSKVIKTLQSKLATLIEPTHKRHSNVPSESPLRQEEPRPQTDVDEEETLSIDDDILMPEPQEQKQRPPTPTTAPPTPSPKREPGLLSKIGQSIFNYFTTGNLIVRVGIILLFIGASFIIRYAAQHDLLPIELRLSALALGAIVLFAFGWRLRHSRRDYALLLQGGGVGIIYLTVFSAFKFYQLLPSSLAFPFLLIFSFVSIGLAVKQNARSMAIMGMLGGYAAPLITSTGEGSHVALFSYYLILNLTVFAAALFRAWRSLNLLAFIFTFVIGSAWGLFRYEASLLLSTELFLITFFVLFNLIAIFYHRVQQPTKGNLVDGTLTFGNAIISLSIQAVLVDSYEYALSLSFFIAGVFYFVLNKITAKLDSQKPLLSQTFSALGLICLTLAIPFAFDSQITSAMWTIEGAGLIWLSLRQKIQWQCALGILVQLGGVLFLLPEFEHVQQWQIYLSILIVSLSLITTARIFERHDCESWQKQLISPYFIGAYVWWLITALIAAGQLLETPELYHFSLVIIGLPAALYYYLAQFRQWSELSFNLLTTPALIMLANLIFLLDYEHLLFGWGLLLIPLSWAGSYWLMLKNRHHSATPYYHFSLYLLITLILSSEAYWLGEHTLKVASPWTGAMIGLVIATSLFIAIEKATIFFEEAKEVYRYTIPLVVAIGSISWFLVYNLLSASQPLPLPYIPLFNPIDLTTGLIVYMLYRWYKKSSLEYFKLPAQSHYWIAGVFSFIWLNSLLLHSLHFYADISYSLYAFNRSALVQTSLSIVWTLLALVIMLLSKRWQQRQVWLVGSSLLGIVVLKLLLKDLSGQQSIERIISFMGVGFLLLVIGYLVPIPPQQPNGEVNEDKPSQ
ncbi:DUF2339 domain-containing protein [Pleionea sp. CnH1-48]|uniref:DUF2339 domain-containing protein n=1 Tax=Pleionea sp. CnH1-48 TaxID=2954494 RepID=UPI0020976241|nr:DUF2339 domain-containing protein [Pleionea sp. CnH1-48]MCO7224708.1 DUF2339 domain-containing protein [Pleionea sp. CnH1-48]